MTDPTLTRRIDVLRTATALDWACYVAVIPAGLCIHITADNYRRAEMLYADVNVPGLLSAYSIFIAALWIGVFMVMGMVRMRIILRGIRRDALEREFRSLQQLDAATTLEPAKQQPVVCPRCDQELALPVGPRLHHAKCGKCGHVFRVRAYNRATAGAGREDKEPEPVG